MATTKRAVELEGLGKNLTAEDIPIGKAGVGGHRRIEPQPEYIKAECEKVIADPNGNYIVLGRDRYANRVSGYGGRGETHCASIDIVAGRMSADGPKKVNEDGSLILVDPSFEADAARIYLSQKSDIDEYFNLAAGKVGLSRTRSGIGIKADAVRIVGREGIKLVTRPEPKNSQGGLIERVLGIDLIAGNDDGDLQPLVKGQNIVNALTRLVEHVGKLDGLVNALVVSQMQLNTALGSHTHIGNTGAPTSTPWSPDSVTFKVQSAATSQKLQICQSSLMALRGRLEQYKKNYLVPSSPDYINSRYNNTN